MSFLSNLGKILGVAGAGLAIPFTGGASAMALPGILGTVGKVASAVAPVLGSAAASRSQGRVQENQDLMTRDRLNQTADIANQKLPALRMGNMSRANMMAAPPMSFSGVKPGMGLRGEAPTFSGGFMNRDPRMAQLANTTMDDTIHSSLTGNDMTRGASPEIGSGVTDKLLGAGAFGSGILGALNTITRTKGQSPVDPKTGKVMPPPLNVPGRLPEQY